MKINNSRRYRMFLGASPKMFERARKLRANMTEAEKVLWRRIRGRALGVKFRAQHPMLNYIVDFYSNDIKLVVEVDGKVHETAEHKEYDLGRSEILEEFGMMIIRFTNKEVLMETEKVIQHLSEIIESRRERYNLSA